MKIYILLAHPDSQSYNGRIADMVEKRAIDYGHEVRRQNLADLHFDPILWRNYKAVQELEPDLQQAQQNITWCEQWIIIYPVWWGSVPALFKGFLDRALLPGFAFKYHDKGPFWDKLLKGRSAHLIATSDAPSIWLWWQYRNSDFNTIKEAVLKYCGFSPVKTHRIGRLKYLTDQQRTQKTQAIVIKILP